MVKVIGAARFNTLAFNLTEALREPGNQGDDLAQKSAEYLAEVIESIDSLQPKYMTLANIKQQADLAGMPYALTSQALIIADRLASMASLDLAMGMKPVMDRYAPELSDLAFVQLGISDMYPNGFGDLGNFLEHGSSKSFVDGLKATDFSSALLTVDLLHGKSAFGDFISPLTNVSKKGFGQVANEYAADLSQNGKGDAFSSKKEGDDTIKNAVGSLITKAGSGLDKIAGGIKNAGEALVNLSKKDIHLGGALTDSMWLKIDIVDPPKATPEPKTPPAVEPPAPKTDEPKPTPEKEPEKPTPPPQGPTPPQVQGGGAAMPAFDEPSQGGPTGCVSPKAASSNPECRRSKETLWSSQNYFEGGTTAAGLQNVLLQACLTASAEAFDAGQTSAHVEIDLGAQISGLANKEIALMDLKTAKDLAAIAGSLGQIPGIKIGLGPN